MYYRMNRWRWSCPNCGEGADCAHDHICPIATIKYPVEMMPWGIPVTHNLEEKRCDGHLDLAPAGILPPLLPLGYEATCTDDRFNNHILRNLPGRKYDYSAPSVVRKRHPLDLDLGSVGVTTATHTNTTFDFDFEMRQYDDWHRVAPIPQKNESFPEHFLRKCKWDRPAYVARNGRPVLLDKKFGAIKYVYT